jgi:hypothetical protein
MLVPNEFYLFMSVQAQDAGFLGFSMLISYSSLRLQNYENWLRMFVIHSSRSHFLFFSTDLGDLLYDIILFITHSGNFDKYSGAK